MSRKIFLVVGAGTFAALTGYVPLGQALLERMLDLQARYNNLVTIIVAVVIAGFALFHLRGIMRWLGSLRE